MISWRDTAFILRATPFNERDMMLDLLTREHGRMRTIAKYGATKKHRNLYQEGNLVACEWKAKQEHQMGTVRAELQHGYLASILNKQLPLLAMQSANALCMSFLYEYDHAISVYAALQTLYQELSDGDEHVAMACYLRFECKLLAACGYALDLSECAATGTNDYLAYISPKTGRAVSASAGEPYKDRLFPFPRFYMEEEYHPNRAELLDASRMNAYFMTKRLCVDHEKTLPVSRERLEQAIRTGNDR